MPQENSKTDNGATLVMAARVTNKDLDLKAFILRAMESNPLLRPSDFVRYGLKKLELAYEGNEQELISDMMNPNNWSK
jgi:hypothetical protein